jgi:hypothetical protein
MSDDSSVDLVTGAFSDSGSRIAERLLESGRRMRTLTIHPEISGRGIIQVDPRQTAICLVRPLTPHGFPTTTCTR